MSYDKSIYNPKTITKDKDFIKLSKTFEVKVKINNKAFRFKQRYARINKRKDNSDT